MIRGGLIFLAAVAMLATSACRNEEGAEGSHDVAPRYDREATDQVSAESSQFPDGTYSATVDYYNPATEYSATYTLHVEVESGQIVQINFPNDGYLDEDHISPADVDENGDAEVEGEDGKTYAVHIEPPDADHANVGE